MMLDSSWDDITGRGTTGPNGLRDNLEPKRTAEQTEEMVSALVAKVEYIAQRIDATEARCEERHKELLHRFDLSHKTLTRLANQVFVMWSFKVSFPLLCAAASGGAVVSFIWHVATH